MSEDIFAQITEAVEGSISPDPEIAASPAGGPGGWLPTEVSEEEVDRLLQSMSDEEKLKRQEYGNTTKVVKLIASAPNAAQYMRQVMGINELKCTTQAVDANDQTKSLVDEVFPIKEAKDPKFTWDGLMIEEASGTVQYVHKDAMIDFIFENAISGLYGDREKYAEVVVRTSRSVQKTPVVRLVTPGFDQTNREREDMLISYEPAMDDQGNPLTKTQSVGLDAPKGLKDGNEVSLRGRCENYPIFQRRRDAEFAKIFDALGEIKSSGRGVRQNKQILSTRDREEKMREMLMAAQIFKATKPVK